MKKTLNIESISSELTGGSAFFPGYQKPEASPTPPPVVPSPQVETPPAQIKPDIPERSNARPPERVKGKRIITRNSFETYEDQMDRLRRLAYREKMEGKIGSMSAMVREAIDDYLLKRSHEK